MTKSRSIEKILNLAEYPILDPTATQRAELVKRCQQELATNLYCVIPDLVSEAALEEMANEAKHLLPHANHNNALRNCYLHRQTEPTLPVDHPRNLQDRSSVRMIAYDQLSPRSPLKTFYQSPVVQTLIADIVGEGKLFVNEDPYQPANYVCYQDGDESSWHFDSDSSFTMTLMVQSADEGGLFEMCPNTRTDSEQNYEKVKRILQGDANKDLVSVGRSPGALCIFKGSNSLHRVSKVYGSTLRIMGVFVYEFSPGVTGDPEVNATIYGPRTVASR